MLKSLVIKELRESVGVIAIAAAAAIYALIQLMGLPINFFPFTTRGNVGFPFVEDQSAFAFGMVIGALAIAMGLKQSAVESWRGTYYFLLHQPASRRSIFATKMLVGAACVLIIGAMMILIYATWAATPGKVPAPFYWSMTIPTWQIWLAMLPVYLGAFLSGIRPARWFGSRLVPLAAAVFIAFMTAWLPSFWLTAVAVLIVVFLIVVSVLFYAERRDY